MERAEPESGQSAFVTFIYRIDPSATGPLTVTSTVIAPAGTTDPDATNNSFTDNDTLTPQADLAVAMTDGKLIVVPGTSNTYTITVTNNGPSTVTSLTLTDMIPAALLNPNFAHSVGAYNVGTGAWSGLNLASGQSASMTLTGTIDPNATGSLTNTVTVTAPSGTTDTNLANNAATDTDTTPSVPPAFALSALQLAAFGLSAGGWSSQDAYPRALADVNGGGMADIVGFSAGGVYESLATGGGHFAMPTFELAAFGTNAGGWTSQDLYPRTLADVSGDTRADIVAFSAAGVYESQATAGGHFATPTFELAAFGTDAGGWSSDNTYPRELADVNGDSMADIVGFGQSGVYVSLATAGGHFATPTFELAAFGTNAGGWSSQDAYPRALADVNGGGMADIVGFSSAGIYESLATGGGHFAMPTFELAAFGTNAGGWSSQDLYPRTLADINGDGMADILGFGADRLSVSLATGGGHFASPTFQLSIFSANAGGWNSDNTFPRHLAEITGDGKADIVGFAANGVWTAPSLT